MCSAGTVYNAQRLNKLLGEHWRSFAGQPYFDDQGVFISAVVSAPLLFTMFVQLVRRCLPLHALLHVKLWRYLGVLPEAYTVKGPKSLGLDTDREFVYNLKILVRMIACRLQSVHVISTRAWHYPAAVGLRRHRHRHR